MKVKGIHHISSTVRHAQENVDFYASVLGMELLKKTVNFDDPMVYHLYYGNANYAVGSAITFFPWNNRVKTGVIGSGQVGVTMFSIPKGSLSFWEQRLKQFNISYHQVNRFGQNYLQFSDPHGLTNVLIEDDTNIRSHYSFNGIDKEHAIFGFYGVTLFSMDVEKTADFLTNHLGLVKIKEDDYIIRFQAENKLGRIIDLFKQVLPSGKMGAGTVHHIAFDIESNQIDDYRTYFEKLGYNVTEVKDRKFFKSIYFREPGGIIVELATTTPGFDHKEELKEQNGLTLPDFHEHLRDEIREKLYPLQVKEISQLQSYAYEDLEGYAAYKLHQKRLARINELASLAKQRELTKDEKNEREVLRKAYAKSIINTIKDNLNNVSVETKEGQIQKLKKKGEQ